MRYLYLLRKGTEGAVGGLEAAVPFVGGDPFGGGDALFLLRHKGLFVGSHGEPRGLLEVPAFGEIRSPGSRSPFENVVGFEGYGAGGLGNYTGFFFYFAKGGLEESLTGLNLAFGEVPAAVAQDEEHGVVGSGDDATGSADVAHAAFQ